MSLDVESVRRLIRIAIDEDLGRGDVTSELSIPIEMQSQAVFLAKEDCVVCGLELLPIIYRELNFSVSISEALNDGTKVKSGAVLAKIAGLSRHILSSERLCLNFLQHLSGIATNTRKVVELSNGLTVLDTRKTTPGFRVLEKYAVRTGGAKNHRLDLGEMVLVKNNHIDALGGDMRSVLSDIFKRKDANMKVEIEVRNENELDIALEYQPYRIMLDNMNDTAVRDAVQKIRAKLPNALIEVSGGVTAERLRSLKECGVDCASMGALTNKINSIDISMRIL